MPHINFNGKISLEGTPVVTSANRGLRYGDGLFETMKILKGKIIQEAAHFERLWTGMDILQFELPKHFTKEGLVKSIQELCVKNGHENAGRIRLNIFRGNGGLYDVINNSPNYIIETWELPPGNGEWNSNGLISGIYSDARKVCDLLSNVKHNNYLPYVLAALKAKKEKWNDAIVLNQYERIADTTIANIFLVKDKEIITPALSEGCVAGIMRKEIIDHLQQKKWTVKEKEIRIEDVLNADEVFFTNSIYNIRWVQRIEDKSYSNEISREIYASFYPTIC